MSPSGMSVDFDLIYTSWVNHAFMIVLGPCRTIKYCPWILNLKILLHFVYIYSVRKSRELYQELRQAGKGKHYFLYILMCVNFKMFYFYRYSISNTRIKFMLLKYELC